MHQHTFKLVFGMFFILLSMCCFVIALDNQLIQQCGGDQELIIGCQGDAQNYFESLISNVTEEAGDDGGDDGGGGGERLRINSTTLNVSADIDIASGSKITIPAGSFLVSGASAWEPPGKEQGGTNDWDTQTGLLLQKGPDSATRYPYIKLKIPERQFGAAVYVDNITIYYRTTHTGFYIDLTEIRKNDRDGTGTLITSDGTNYGSGSTGYGSYTLTSGWSRATYPGDVYVQFVVTDSGSGVVEINDVEVAYHLE